eukprot:TRINITY_DN1030_c0_g2_i1.p1 TRINITY_DN1030_c0_g2~~TRINITY_DN1030_c0_g2_i1.p1  ORF type:complete len:586 (-),score=186.46 TRINITY_DN1030_c0_g2_i1:31-1788(-)
MRKADDKGESFFTIHNAENYLQVLCRSMGESEYSITCSDVSDIKILEKELMKQKEALEHRVEEQTRELKSALEVKSRFLATMSHEIRTPLSGVMGSLSHLSEMENLSIESKEMLRIGQVCGEQLLYVINDVLDLSKIEANQLVLDKETLFLEEVLEESMDIINVQAEKKGIDLIFNLNLPPHFAVSVDNCRMKQIVINLLSNSVKFTQKGEIVLSAEVIERVHKYAIIQISVKDSGSGIPDEFRSNIFTPFSQGDTSTTRRFGGTGLGLSISKRLAELFGGKMWFETTVGKGTEFFFTVKLKVVPSPSMHIKHMALERIESHLSSIEEKRALVVERNAKQLESLKGKLEKLGFSVIGFKSTSEITEENLKPTELGKEKSVLFVRGHSEEEIEAANKLSPHFKSVIICTNGRIITTKQTLRCPTKRYQLLLALDQTFFEGKLGSEAFGKKIIPQNGVGLKGLRVLLAEDNLLNQKVIKRMLDNLEVQVTAVDNGKKAVEAVQNQDFDLILMDCMMPEMGGIEATKYIRENLPKEKQMLIFALTADVFEDNKKKCMNAGMNEILLKPIDQSQLRSTLEKWIVSIPNK